MGGQGELWLGDEKGKEGVWHELGTWKKRGNGAGQAQCKIWNGCGDINAGGAERES